MRYEIAGLAPASLPEVKLPPPQPPQQAPPLASAFEHAGWIAFFQSTTKRQLGSPCAPQAISDLIGGQVPVAVSNIPALLPPIQSGRARAIAVTSLKRSPQLPSVPTVDESGYKGFEVTSWYGVCAPAGTAAAILDKVNSDLSKVLRSADVQARMTELVIEAAPTSREAFAAFIAAETKRWAQVVKDAGVAIQ